MQRHLLAEAHDEVADLEIAHRHGALSGAAGRRRIASGGIKPGGIEPGGPPHQ